VRRLLFLSTFTDLDDAHLRSERLAHEFNQLDASVQAELRLQLNAIPLQRYPYDLPGAVVEWMQAGPSWDYFPLPIHPMVQEDMRTIAHKHDHMWDRRVMSLELYALSRMLKDTRNSTPRLAVIYAGEAHCRNASYFLHGMYNIHGAAACKDDSGCIDFATPTDACYKNCLVGDYLLEEDDLHAFNMSEPHRPMTWGSPECPKGLRPGHLCLPGKCEGTEHSAHKLFSQ
jgi:hypothetical protein